MEPFPFDDIPDDLIWSHIIPGLTSVEIIDLLSRAISKNMHMFIHYYIFPAIRAKKDKNMWRWIDCARKARIVLYCMQKYTNNNISRIHDALYILESIGIPDHHDGIFWDEEGYAICEFYRLMIKKDVDIHLIMGLSTCENVHMKQQITATCMQLEKLHILDALLSSNEYGVEWLTVVKTILDGRIAAAKLVMKHMKLKGFPLYEHQQACSEVLQAVLEGDENYMHGNKEVYPILIQIKHVVDETDYATSMRMMSLIPKKILHTLKRYFKLVRVPNFLHVAKTTHQYLPNMLMHYDSDGNYSFDDSLYENFE